MKKVVLIFAFILFAFAGNSQNQNSELEKYLRDSLPAISERCKDVLSAAYMAQTYVETDYTFPNWQGFPVKLYEYKTGVDNDKKEPKIGRVYMLNPSPERLALWVITACYKVKQNLNYEYTNKLLNFIKWQSGAQFPVCGVVYEDMYTKGSYVPYIFKDGVTVYIADSLKAPQNNDCTEQQLTFYTHLKNSDLKPNTGRYARISSTTREQYYANGGTENVGNSDTTRAQAWMDVIRQLYQKAWTSNENELITAWAKANL